MAFAIGVAVALASPVRAQTLSGTVTSFDGAAMEGVLVSAQMPGSPISVTVVTGADGRYAFPAGRLPPGQYGLRIRAAGYKLDGPASAAVADKPATADLKLRKLQRVMDIAAQLTSTEWLISMPGSNEQKRPLIECMSCHTLERVARSTFSAADFPAVLKRMGGYANNSTVQKPQLRVAERHQSEELIRKVSDYLATVNLSQGPWRYDLKTLPRPSGRATRVIITEYDLPRATIAPHDVRADKNGFIWYSNFVEPTIGRLDPRTGAHAEFTYDLPRKDFPEGTLALEPDADGNWWLSAMFQGGLLKFDPKTEKFTHYPVQPELMTDATQQSMVMPAQSAVDGKVWTNDVSTHQIWRLDLATGRYETVDPFKLMAKGRIHSPYGLAADAQNNLYFMDFGDESIGRVAAKNMAATIYPTPTPASRPRRTMIDGQGRLWFAEFAANKVAMFDIKREEFKEWDVPTPHTYPYDVYLDKNGDLWSGSMSSDRVLRFNPVTGQSVEYLLPRQTNIRRVFVDNSTTPPTFWVGNNHHAAIIKLEPLD